MHKDDPKLSPWMMAAVIACCALPLLILFGGGSVLAFGTSFLTNNLFLLILGLGFAFIFIWLLIKRRGHE